MKKSVGVLLSSMAAVLAVPMLSIPSAQALPNCEQEVFLRCNGYGLQNNGSWAPYYDNFDDCYDTEIVRCEDVGAQFWDALFYRP